jgi:hypothetical protein
VEGYGDVRVSSLEKGKTGNIGFADLFRVLPLGATPATTGPSKATPGYPLCRFGIWLVELKAAFEVTAALATPVGGHDDLYLVPAGFKFEYDTSRPAFNSAGDLTDKNNGRVTKIYMQTSHDGGNYDRAAGYVPVFDITTSAGWLAPPLMIVKTVATLYVATFATRAGIHLKNPDTGAPLDNNDATPTILHRSNGTEIKAWEALGAYVKAQATANGGKLPSRYDKNGTGTVFPRRAICSGPLCVL